jgi:protein-tyrosine phosphatase
VTPTEQTLEIVSDAGIPLAVCCGQRYRRALQWTEQLADCEPTPVMPHPDLMPRLAPEDGPYRICFVCSGNICRSPMAEVVLRSMVTAAGLDEVIIADSAGTGEWHIGERADRRTVATLARRGYDGSSHRARQFEPDWVNSHDLIIAMDHGHLRTLHSWVPTPHGRNIIRLLRGFDPSIGPHAVGTDLDVPDPYYDGPEAFATVLGMIESACAGLLDQVVASLRLSPQSDRAMG